MAVEQNRQWGVTGPISTSLPNEDDLTRNVALIDELKKQNSYEASDETDKRQTTLQTLQKIATEFVRHVCKKKGLPPSTIESAGGKIFTYGSYRLGVYGPGSDIDTLVVVPKYITREDFFEYLPPILKRMAPPGAIEGMKPVPDAYVPILKFEFSGIEIDLIFSRLAVSSVPLTLDLKDKGLLRGLDEQDLRSLNGTRVTDEILELVPQKTTFRTALRAIKLWAQRRAIYANVIGFPGGVAWAMLVARVCQLYPQATGATVVAKFFRIIGDWHWPAPVLLKKIEDGPLQVPVWNPKVYHSDRSHLMPIITPAYPSMCATHNISQSTRKIIIRELRRGEGLAGKISDKKAEWKDLFDRHTFFTEGYKYYLSVVVGSRTKDAQKIWCGLVESRVRYLVSSLDHEVPSIEIAHPFNKGFDRIHHCKDEQEIDAVISGDLRYQEIKTEATDLSNDPKRIAAAQDGANGMVPSVDSNEILPNGDGKYTIYTSTFYIGIELAEDQTKKLDITWQVKHFKQRCTSWAQYDENLMSLSIVNTRSYDLPSDVFQPGEVRPTKPKKKTLKKAEPNGKKRAYGASELEDASQSQSGIKRQQSSNGTPIANSS